MRWYPSARSLRLLALAAVVGVNPTSVSAQNSMKSDWSFSAGALFDTNPFKLTNGQKNDLGSGLDRFLDMDNANDAVVAVGIDAVFRTKRSHGRRTRFGFGFDADVHALNSSRTRFSGDVFLAQSFSRADELKVKFGLNPSEFRRNYLMGEDGTGAPTYSEGVLDIRTGSISYERELYDGKGTGLAMELSGTALWRTTADMPWRDRTMYGAGISFDAQLSKAVDLEIGVERSQASHDGGLEPVFDVLTGVDFFSLNRDFVQMGIGSELRFDLNKDARLSLAYERRTRDFDAALGTDPVYGDRFDTRSAVSGELRYEVSKAADLFVGGAYIAQDTRRPAGGNNTDEVDYRRSQLSIRLVFTR
ncbi:MAG: hypothetical protein OEZ37_04055 [Gemmatimonadota bacterium]|nr:hypothetical protein [Gemmatimonadota bacterium]